MTTPPDVNPYAPPTAYLGDQPIDAGSADLASRWQRLGAALFDLLPTLAAVTPFFIAGYTAARSGQVITDAESGNPLAPFLLVGVPGIVSLVVLSVVTVTQWILLGVRGQTLGKMIAGIRVVRLDGSRASFVRTVVFRNWPFFVLGIVLGKAGNVLGMVDALFVFRRDKRCLHDLIAGTKVIRVPPNA